MKYTPKNSGVTARPRTRLLDRVRGRLRVRHYNQRTEQAYLSWIRRFILASGSYRNVLRIDQHHESDEIPSVRNLA